MRNTFLYLLALFGWEQVTPARYRRGQVGLGRGFCGDTDNKKDP